MAPKLTILATLMFAALASSLIDQANAAPTPTIASLTRRAPQVFVDGDGKNTGIGLGDSFVDVGRDSSIVIPGRDGVVVDRDNKNGIVVVDNGRNAAIVDQVIGDVEVFDDGKSKKVQKRSPQVLVDGNRSGTRIGIDNGDARVDIRPDVIDVIPGRNGVDVIDMPDEGIVVVDDGRNTSIVDEVTGTVEVFDENKQGGKKAAA
ncbi:hypothetical protein BCR44DRAFT_1503472 [Catenaria anguillulae PL171]|uniref:Uncharacterized protein n=1 Tax=Catenaria anguillulae PL171 TaxID=765915 RepID=A0A1Y2H7Y5_9FUNG|nr:hypothetical protein BCR44DRAFT_1503472 [Catenaria anguillulae PL171]